jgi:hypothetical protein
MYQTLNNRNVATDTLKNLCRSALEVKTIFLSKIPKT